MKSFSRMMTRSAFRPGSRLQSKAGICEYLGNISDNTYNGYRSQGIVPGPVPGTNRYDVKAHDLALDKIAGSGGAKHKLLSPLEQWEGAYEG